MVKPALPYLDIIADAAELAADHPLACYQVSGEFAMVHAGAKAGVYDLRVMAFETTESMVRAGTYLVMKPHRVQAFNFLFARCNSDSFLLYPRVLGMVGGLRLV